MAEFRYRRRPLAAGGVFVAGVALATLLFGPRPEARSVVLVRDYFEAIRDRKVAKALATAGIERPKGEAGRFLVPEALDDDWAIDAITEEYSYGDTADVSVVLVGKDGKRQEFTVPLLKQDGRLRFKKPPLVWARFSITPMPYVEAGKVRAPFRKEAGDGTDSVTYQMLPGFYRFYQGSQDVLRVDSRQRALLPNEASAPATVEAPDLTVTPAGERKVSRAYNAFLDQCAKKGGLPAGGCPFGPEQSRYVRTRDDVVFDPQPMAWKVRKYPTVAVGAAGASLGLVDRERGIVELSGVGRIGDEGPEKRFTVACEALSNAIEATIGMDGGISIGPAGFRMGRAGGGIRGDTCRDAPLSVR